MEYLVCYDLKDDRRRIRIAEVLLDFGQRIQESVFIVFLEPPLHEKMLIRLQAELEPTEDKLHVFAICDGCAGKTLALGQGRVPKDEDYYIV
ncbi:CRISPR-associated endonuclease Cas2 [Paludibaculum fermentans]|uniref:CRISPR-associated endonuclease Cas2 n=1 Tax=Paludibaculum fermentans TaxID=1473598 RepID=UPI003EB7EF25